MTNLLDTTNLLLNSSTIDIGLGKSSKDYSQMMKSNVKNFNDILSGANNNYIKDRNLYENKNQKLSINDSAKESTEKEFDVDLKNDKYNSETNVQNTNSQKQEVDKNKLNKQNSENRNNQKNQDSDTNNRDLENNDTNLEDSLELNERTKIINLSDIKDSELNLLKDMSLDVQLENFVTDTQDLSTLMTSSSLQNSEDVLTDTQDLLTLMTQSVDMISEDETAQADLYINAYYQSTLDALNPIIDETLDLMQPNELNSVMEILPVETSEATLTNVESSELVMSSVLNQETSETANLVDTTVESDLLTTDTDVDSSSLSSIKTSDDKKSALKLVNDKKEQILSNNSNDALKSTGDTMQISENDVFTQIDADTQNEVMVDVADDIVEQIKSINTSKTDSKTSFRDAMERADLTDKKLESLGTTITNISSSSQNMENNLGQSSAQEQVAKISLETQGKKDISGKDFSKLIDNQKFEEQQPKDISKNDILAQISNKMQARTLSGNKTVTLQLTPENLGKVTVELLKGKDGMQAKLLTDNFQVKEMLEKSIDSLKTTLASQGVSVNSVSVKVAAPSESSSDLAFNREFNRETFDEGNFERNFDSEGRNDENNSQYSKRGTSEYVMNAEAFTEISADEIDLEFLNEKVLTKKASVV